MITVHRLLAYLWKKRYCSGAQHFQISLMTNSKKNMHTTFDTATVWRVNVLATLHTGTIIYILNWSCKVLKFSFLSCIKIIQGNPPSTGDHHGCPFRHFSHENLATRLYRDKFSAAQVNEILDLVRNRHYQIACTKYYEFTHPQQTDKIDAIEHPNQYFEASKSASAANDAETNGDAMEVDR